jgi:hypothetical protein
LSRRFLRLCESLIAASRARSLRETDLAEAGTALDTYISAKELQIYQAYSSTAESARVA